jgi:chromosome segregation ATPase
VASEKKAIEELKTGLEREMREEQKALSARISSASEKSLKRVSDLSGEVSAEKEDLAAQRAKFSQNVESANQAIASLDGLAKALESRLKKHEDVTAARIQKSEAAISDSIKRISSLTVALEKSGSFSKDLDARLGKVDSQAYSERKALLEKVKNLDSGLKASTLAISNLNRQLKAAGSEAAAKAEKQKLASERMAKEQDRNAEFRNGVEKRLAGQQEYMKGLESAITRIAKMIESMNLEDKSLEKRLAEHKEEIVKRILEEQKLDKKEVSGIREEFEALRKELKEWQEEQAKLYELLKED